MERGMIFDLYQDGQDTKRVLAINEKDVICLTNGLGTIIKNIDFENEADNIVVNNVFEL